METQRSRGLSDFSITPRVLYLSFLSLIVGCAGAFMALILTRMIGFFTNLLMFHRLSFAFVPAYPNSLGWGIVLVPAAGGIVIGLMARFGSDKIRGHGIPEAMEAILIHKSVISPKVAVLKPISAALSIGSGGPFGAEGPIIMSGGSIGSVIGQYLLLSAAERKILLLAGAAAGMCATFNAPIASVMFVVELLAFEMRPRSIMPIALASAAAAFIRIGTMGAGPVFPSHAQLPDNTEGLLIALLFGVAGPAVAYILTRLIYGSEDLFAKIPLHWMYWPAIGGLVVGAGGYFVPQVLGVGYDTIRDLTVGQIALQLALEILIVKAVVWIVALGSGTSGGILAPLLIIGGTLGEAAGLWLHASQPAAWSLLGMAAVFAGVTRSPFTAVLFLMELTHDMAMILPLTAACGLAAGLSALMLPRSILTEKIARRGRLVARDYRVDPLELVTAGELAEELPAGMPAERRPAKSVSARKTAAEALALLLRDAGSVLTVVDDLQRPVGVLQASSLLKLRQRMAEEEHVRERYLRLSRQPRLLQLKIHALPPAHEDPARQDAGMPWDLPKSEYNEQ